jgi:guanylate kinase
VILSGPSCVGKGPLCAALRRLRPELLAGLARVTLYNSRAPRPAERDGVDYHFRPRAEIDALRARDGFLIMDVRGDLQALDLGGLRDTLRAGDALFEGNPFVGTSLLEMCRCEGVEVLGVFLAPLSREEILELRAPESRAALPGFVAEVMRRKLLRRTSRQRGELCRADLEEVERRCTSAYAELKLAHSFDQVIPCHDGEDSENWDAFSHPLGDARRAMLAFAELLSGRFPAYAERWEPDLLP